MEIDIKDMEGLEVFLGYKCNVKCIFCFQKDIRLIYNKSFPKEHIEKILLNGFNEGKRYVIFSGGEPTLDMNLGNYISYANKLGYKHIRVHTNGFGFKNYDYLNNLYNRGLSGITISIHGYANVHDNITRVEGSFNIITKALNNFNEIQKIDKNFVVDTNTIIYKGNIGTLMKLFLYLFRFNINRYQINFVSSLDTFTQEEKRELIVPYNFFVKELKDILSISLKFHKKLVIDSIPYCVVGKHFQGFIDNNIKNDRESISPGYHDYTYDETYRNIKPDICNKCSYFIKCRGIPEDYYQLFKDKDLKPI